MLSHNDVVLRISRRLNDLPQRGFYCDIVSHDSRDEYVIAVHGTSASISTWKVYAALLSHGAWGEFKADERDLITFLMPTFVSSNHQLFDVDLSPLRRLLESDTYRAARAYHDRVVAPRFGDCHIMLNNSPTTGPFQWAIADLLGMNRGYLDIPELGSVKITKQSSHDRLIGYTLGLGVGVYPGHRVRIWRDSLFATLFAYSYGGEVFLEDVIAGAELIKRADQL